MKPRHRHIPRGEFRSQFEKRIAEQLATAGVRAAYEQRQYGITLPAPGMRCNDCRSPRVSRITRYTPDFHVYDGNTLIFVMETKGKFTGRDRKVALAYVAQHGLPYRMLFMRDNLLSKTSKTRYSDWCREHDIPYAVGSVPPEWIQECK
jgi:hypothetical protein